MENKRSKGVTFWGWVFIIGGILGIWAIFGHKFQIGSITVESKHFGLVDSIVFLLFSGAYILCGLFVLRLDERARKTVIWLTIILMLYIFLSSLFQIIKSANWDKLPVNDHVTVLLFLLVAMLENVLIAIFQIYFFTRPKVKEQFKAVSS